MPDGSTGQPGKHLEVETVLDVDPDFTLPALDAPGVSPHSVVQLSPVQVHELDALYYDTPDLVLIRAGITLRRRTGGPDEGWHLKLPGDHSGDDSGDHSGDRPPSTKGRLEVMRPLGPQASAPPAALLALVQGRLRGRDVVPVVRLRTTRTVHDLLGDDGARLAELADDAVVAQVLNAGASSPDFSSAGFPDAEFPDPAVSDWRELEVELVDSQDLGLLTAVGDALVDAGARPARIPSKLGRALAGRLDRYPPAPVPKRTGGASATVLGYLAEQYDELLRRDPMVRLDAPDGVHKMRIALRRVRTTLAAFRPLFSGDDGERLRAEAAWIGNLLGEARDAEVIRNKLLAEVDEQPSELMVGPLHRRIGLELGRRYTAGHAGAVRGLDSQRYADLLTDLEAFLADPPLAASDAKVGRKALVEGVRKAHERIRKAAHQAGVGSDQQDQRQQHDELLHDVRKAAKRSRYAADLLQGKKAKRYAKAAKAVQEILGEHHDSVVLQEWLLDLATRAHRSGESAFGYGVLHADLAHRRALDEEEFATAWHDLDRAAKDWLD